MDIQRTHVCELDDRRVEYGDINIMIFRSLILTYSKILVDVTVCENYHASFLRQTFVIFIN